MGNLLSYLDNILKTVSISFLSFLRATQPPYIWSDLFCSLVLLCLYSSLAQVTGLPLTQCHPFIFCSLLTAFGRHLYKFHLQTIALQRVKSQLSIPNPERVKTLRGILEFQGSRIKSGYRLRIVSCNYIFVFPRSSFTLSFSLTQLVSSLLSFALFWEF